MRERPGNRTIGCQRWSHLLFAHWRVDPDEVQAKLPRGLQVDTFRGDAYVGIVPFFMDRIRPAWLPPLPWLSWFLELNVRTYVHDENGRPGVWFFSLDCNQPVAVEIARRFFRLPYIHAKMSAQHSGGTTIYRCLRHGVKGPQWEYQWHDGSDVHEAEAGTLEFFLVERYALFAVGRDGRLYEGRVFHYPYRIQTPVVDVISADPAHLIGFDLVGAPCSVLATAGVDVSIYPLQAQTI